VAPVAALLPFVAIADICPERVARILNAPAREAESQPRRSEPWEQGEAAMPPGCVMRAAGAAIRLDVVTPPHDEEAQVRSDASANART
jgi:hypothetical protein